MAEVMCIRRNESMAGQSGSLAYQWQREAINLIFVMAAGVNTSNQRGAAFF